MTGHRPADRIGPRQEVALLLLLLSVIAGVYFTTLHADHNWGDDFAQYLQEAINITRGVDIADNGYICSRYAVQVAPPVYPPGFPLLLAPVYAVFGLDMRAFQLEIILLQLLALIVIYCVYRCDVRPATALILLLMFGLSPYVISFKRQVMSDVPYLLVSMAFVLAVERLEQQSIQSRWALAGTACLAGAACLIRSIGLVSLVALLVRDLIRHRSPTRLTVWATVATISMAGICRFVLGGDLFGAGYIGQIARASVEGTMSNVDHYFIESMRGFWAGPSFRFSTRAVPVLWLLAIPMIVYGFQRRCKRSGLYVECFFLGHLAAVLVFPFAQELRYLYPLLPLLLLFAGIGFESASTQLARRTNRRLARAVCVTCAVGVLAIYAVRTPKVIAAEQPVADGPYSRPAQELFRFVRTHTDVNARFVSYKPRALALFGERHAAALSGQERADIVYQIDEVEADYALLKRDANPAQTVAMTALVRDCPESFQSVFRSETFDVYRIDRSALRTCRATASVRGPAEGVE